MCVTRSAEAGCLVLATCALFDTRVFLVSWRAHVPCAHGSACAHVHSVTQGPELSSHFDCCASCLHSGG